MPTVPAPSSAKARWILDGSRASAVDGLGRIDLADVASGLAVRGGSHALGIDLPPACRPAEAWVRGRDLTAIFEPSDPRRLRITAMWRALGHPSNSAAVDVWELVLSTQTSLLETAATVDVFAQAAGSVTSGRWDGDTVHWEPDETGGVRSCLWVWNHSEITARGPRDATAGEGLLLAIHPRDTGSLSWIPDASGSVAIRCRLFPQDVEKGVLLRSRMLAAAGHVDRDWNADWMAPVLEDFARSPPMLSV